MPYLKQFTVDGIEALKKFKTVTIPLANGWYSVSVLGRQTVQQTEITDVKRQRTLLTGLEPTFEFIITPSIDKPIYSADINYSFTIVSDGYSTPMHQKNFFSA